MNKNVSKNTRPLPPASAPYWRHVLGEAAPSSSPTSPPNNDSASNNVIEAEIDDEIISNGLDAEDTMAPDLFQQSLTKLLRPKKKERHYFSIAEDVLRDLDENGEW